MKFFVTRWVENIGPANTFAGEYFRRSIKKSPAIFKRSQNQQK
jgi:hypothetical protein